MEIVSKFPHKVVVQILRADNLLRKPERKGKGQMKWKVIIMGSRKKCMTEYSPCPLGNPIWNCEMTLKLARNQFDPIVLLVVDISNNQVGQVVLPIVQIREKGSTSDQNSNSIASLRCNELEPSRKCEAPTGHLFYRVWVEEYFQEEIITSQIPSNKRHSIFGWKQDTKTPYLNEAVSVTSKTTEKSKVSKRLSVFKSIGKSENTMFRTGKAKSLANIHTADLVEEPESSESDIDKQTCFPPDNIYDHVTQDLGWVRVRDLPEDRTLPTLGHQMNGNGNGAEIEKVEVWSVQPDNGPITGNFTVVMEGSNFTSGLFELTYVCIDDLEPIDATICTEIVSDTEMIVNMPAVPRPGMVNISLELLDGSMITCSKTFHYTDPCSEESHVFTPRYFDNDFPKMFQDDPEDQCDDMLSSPKLENVDNTGILKRDSGMGSFKEKIKTKGSRRRLSDYGSLGSIYSDRVPSIRRSTNKHTTMSKMELFEEVTILRNEVADLKAQLKELASSTSIQITAFKCQLEARDSEIDNISHMLCNLKVKLLEDGLTQYLELK